MKRRLFPNVCAPVLTIALLFARPATAQQPGDAGVFFDALGTQTTRSVETGELFEFYIVVFDTASMLGWEAFAVANAVTPPTVPGLTVLSYQNNGPHPIDVDGPVGFSECVDVTGAFWLRRYWGMYLSQAGTDDLYCLEATVPSSFSPPTPGYLSCSGELVPLRTALNGNGVYPDACAVVNPTHEPPVAAAQPSWSALKSVFGTH